MSNNPSHISKSEVISTSLSDHEMVGCLRKINHFKYQPKTLTTRSYRNYDPVNINSDFQFVNWNNLYNKTDINEALQLFNETVLSIVNQHAPYMTKNIKGRNCPWLDQDIKKLMDTRDQALRRHRRSKSLHDWTCYKKLRNSCNNKLKQAKQTFHKNNLSENLKDPKKFGGIIKEIFPTKSRPQMTSNVSMLEEEKKCKAELFCSYFSSAVSDIKLASNSLTNYSWKKRRSLSLRKTKNSKNGLCIKCFYRERIKKS